MKRQTLLAALLGTFFLASCAGTSQRLMYTATNPEQMKKANLVGHSVEYCRKGKLCIYDPANFVLVTKQDEFSISLDNGETILYSDIGYLTYAASKADEIKNDMVKALLLPAAAACSAVSNGCWR